MGSGVAHLDSHPHPDQPHQQCILTFARECRANIEHSSDEWTNVLNVAEEYEKYVEKNNVTNGIITQDTAYLRMLYQELSREHKI